MTVSLLKKLYYMTIVERFKSTRKAIILSVLLAGVELIGTLSPMPFIYLITFKSGVDNKYIAYLEKLYSYLNIEWMGIITFTGILCLSILFASIFFRGIFQYSLNIYIEGTRSYLSERIFNNVINDDFVSFDKVNFIV